MAPLIIGAGLELVKMFAPKLVGAIAGSKGEDIAQDFVDMATNITGEHDPLVAVEKIKAESNFRMLMANQVAVRAKELDDLYLDDKKDARARDIQMRQLGYKNSRADLMLVGAYLILAAVIVALSGFQVNEAVQGILAMLAGGMLKAITDAFQFEFGSSRGSKEKSIQLSDKGEG